MLEYYPTSKFVDEDGILLYLLIKISTKNNSRYIKKEAVKKGNAFFKRILFPVSLQICLWERELFSFLNLIGILLMIRYINR